MFHPVGVGGVIICTPGLSPGAIVVKALQAKGIIIFTPFFLFKNYTNKLFAAINRALTKHAPPCPKDYNMHSPGC